MSSFPVLMHTAVDAPDCRGLAEFYRELLGLRYRPGDEPPDDGSEDDADWLVLVDSQGQRVLAVQQKSPTCVRSTWPSEDVPMQMHLDFRVPTLDELHRHRQRAAGPGGRTLLHDRSEDGGEPLFVLADPAGAPLLPAWSPLTLVEVRGPPPLVEVRGPPPLVEVRGPPPEPRNSVRFERPAVG